MPKRFPTVSPFEIGSKEFLMPKSVLIISASPRVGGNSDILCDYFAQGAAGIGAQIEKISLADKKIGFCTGCYACHSGACPQKDDAADIIGKMQKADVIVLATPVYFYTMCAQLKALIDRSVMVYPNITGKKMYFIMTMADTAPDNFKGTIEALRGFTACCEGSSVAGMVCCPGVYEKGEILRSSDLQLAYETGRTV